MSAGDLLWEQRDPGGRPFTAAELVDEEDHLTLTVWEPAEAAAVRLTPEQADALESALRGWRLSQ